MAMKPGIGKRFSRDAERRHLLDAWASLTSVTDRFTLQQADELFETLRQAVGTRITQEAASGARLGDYGERAYDHLARLMDTYREALLLYGQNRDAISVFTIKNILEGLYAVLVSRVRQFNDTAGSETQNPVAAEKKAIFQNAAGYAVQQIDSQARLFAARFLPGANGCYAVFRRAFLDNKTFHIGSVLAALDAMQDAARDFCFKGLFAFYRDGLRICLGNLNDFKQRETAQYYLDLCENEWDVLGDIIKIQANALEFAVAHGETPIREQEVVQHILTLLREGYQYFGQALSEMRRATAEKADALPQDAVAKPYAEFEQYLNERLAEYKQAAAQRAQSMPPKLEDQKALFFSLLDKETDALFEQIRLLFMQTLYRFQRVLSETAMLADEMAEVFVKLRADWPDTAALPPRSPEADILHGILETLDIKIESMKDSLAGFNESGAKTINEFAAGKKEVTFEDRLSAYNEVFDAWITEMTDAEPKPAAFFGQCAALPAFEPLRVYYDKRESEYAARIEKAIFSFKRESLLYEVSTYEEILLYSVSRLRDSALPPVQQAVALLDDALGALEMILKKNNIQVIRPAPHETFNGREHEVLMAEKQDGFQKGEIIKSVNSGYRQRDAVILRANVIAAK